MERDRRGKPPPQESSAFDLSKSSEAEIAARIAARMAEVRRARRAPDAAMSAPPAREPAVPPHADPSRLSPPAQEREAGARVDRAMRTATPPRAPHLGEAGPPPRRPHLYGAAFESLLAEGFNMNAIGMSPERRVDQALRRVRALRAKAQAGGIALLRAARSARESRSARVQRLVWAFSAAMREAATTAWHALEKQRAHVFGVSAARAATAAWRATATALERRSAQALHHVRRLGLVSRHATAGHLAFAAAGALTIAIAAWFLTTADNTSPRERAAEKERSAQTERTAQMEPTSMPPSYARPALPAPATTPAQPPPPPQARLPDTAQTPLPPRLKPAPRPPALTAQMKPSPTRDRTAPTDAPPPSDQPATPPRAREPQPAPDEPRTHPDPRELDTQLKRMFSDGIGKGLSRR